MNVEEAEVRLRVSDADRRRDAGALALRRWEDICATRWMGAMLECRSGVVRTGRWRMELFSLEGMGRHACEGQEARTQGTTGRHNEKSLILSSHGRKRKRSDSSNILSTQTFQDTKKEASMHQTIDYIGKHQVKDVHPQGAVIVQRTHRTDSLTNT